MNRTPLQRADDAIRLGEHIAAIAVLFLAILGLSWVALMGDDIRAARMGITVHELDHREWAEVEARIEAARAEHQNRCGWGCIRRIDSQGETWPNQGASE